MADFVTVANEFAKYYYNTFDSDRTRLAPLYRENSMMTFETNQHQGVSPIIEKLTSLPFGKVTGELVIDDSEHPQRYSQCFHLVPEGESYYVLNDIFRLVYC
ncbi:uncharacterized protein LAJ45_09495 [Morchella importuna]|uniref:uncharacterized protein n=1 Tax=Morchella importuna TaxID=1174673 RepID=UPI001E8D7FF8|nr:uncharacterized protein LAJ45_09495 [Morchella importuna]KAH8146549.1 hypothetical protein LAJ45_09495 [Morchella importuna]